MKITLEREKENIIRLDIVIPAKDAQNAYENALKRFAQYVTVDGFRKGKAPKHLVERQVGPERLKAEAIENIMPQAMDTAVKKNNLDLITQPYISSYEFEIGEDMKITARAEVRPEVKLGTYKGLSVKVMGGAIPADAFDKAVENLLHQYTEEVTVAGRAANNTDIAVIDFDGYVNGEKLEGGEGKAYPLDLGNSNFIPGFAEGIVGHNIGEEFDITVKFPDDYHENKLQGQPAVFKIKINELKEKKLPEFNDEFAKRIGPFKSLDELKEDINQFLANQHETANRQNSENEVFRTVVEASAVEIPSSMIAREIESLKNEYRARLSQQGVDWEMFIKSPNGDSLLKSLDGEAKVRIKNSLVIDQIAKNENMKLEPKDIEQKFADISTAYGVSPSEVAQQFGRNPEFIASISQQALNDKVRDFLMTNNKVVFIESVKKDIEAAKTKAPKETAKAKAKPAAKKTKK